jgi:murein DD-endopeptidase MepM/ murein hydrolase activator NlpD
MQRHKGTPLNDKTESATAPEMTRGRWLFIGLTFFLLGCLLLYTLTTTPTSSAPEATTPPATLSHVTPRSFPTPSGQTIDFVVRRHDTLEKIFRHLRLSLDDLAAILDLPGVRTRLAQIQPGDRLTVAHTGGLVQTLAHRISETGVLSVTRGDSGFAAETIETPIEIRPAQVHGTISSSLFAAASAAGINPETTLRLANDIFGWDIDFALDIQPGDRFSVVYERKYREGQYIGDARILAAEFINSGETHRAIYYVSDDGKIADYFAPDGRSMRRQFVRAPLDFTRVSSNFNRARRHPILNTLRAHQGVDYSAPTGTVIKAAGEGRVSFAGLKGGYGKVVVLEHGRGISTLYGHLSRFAPATRNGQRVKQGATIGYVGSSGAATGPHLHYEYRVNGVHQNPRTVKLPDAAPIASDYAADFQSKSSLLLADLERARSASMVAERDKGIRLD